MKQKSFAQLIRELTGMTKEQYKTAYNKFAAQVRNYNRVAGTRYQAAREFYYSFKYADAPSPALRAIEATKATRAHKRGEYIALGEQSYSETLKEAITVTKTSWNGLITKSAGAAEFMSGGIVYKIADAMENGVKDGKRLSNDVRKYFKETPVPDYIYSAIEAGDVSPDIATEIFKLVTDEAAKRKSKDPAFHY